LAAPAEFNPLVGSLHFALLMGETLLYAAGLNVLCLEINVVKGQQILSA
jgi:hypothetical protein